MSLQLTEITNVDDFKKLVAVEHEAYKEPFNSFWEALKGPTVEECAIRQWSWHTGTAGSRWLKVTDTTTGEIIGGVEWIIHQTNPFETEKPAIKASWWDKGPLKDMSDQMLDTFFGQRPKHRRRGAGRLMMEWGCKIADEMELDSFVESTDDGKSLYESAGFRAVDYFTLDAQSETPSTEWIKLKQDILPQPYRVWFMWRPKGGKYEAGKTAYPWENKSAA